MNNGLVLGAQFITISPLVTTWIGLKINVVPAVRALSAALKVWLGGVRVGQQA